MGKLTDGVFGGFSGKVGRVVGYSIGGEDMLRKMPRKKSQQANIGQAAGTTRKV